MAKRYVEKISKIVSNCSTKQYKTITRQIWFDDAKTYSDDIPAIDIESNRKDFVVADK